MLNKILCGLEIECLSPYENWDTLKILKKCKYHKIKWCGERNKPRPSHLGYVTCDTSIRIGNDSGCPTEISTPVFQSPNEMCDFWDNITQLMKQLNFITNDSTSLHVSLSYENKDLMRSISPFRLWYSLNNASILSKWNRLNNFYCKDIGEWCLYEICQKLNKKELTLSDVEMIFNKKYKSMANITTPYLGTISRDRIEQSKDGKFFAITTIHSPRRIEYRHIGGRNYHTKVTSEDLTQFVNSLEDSISPIHIQPEKYINRLKSDFEYIRKHNKINLIDDFEKNILDSIKIS